MSLKDDVTERIRRAITSGELALGAKLSENSLAEKLGVSRTPVRESLQVLALDGLVKIKPQRGTFVFDPSDAEIVEICAFRTTLECAALDGLDMAAAAPAIEAILLAAEHALDKGDLAACHGLDTEFHTALIGHSGNRYLLDAYRSISDRVTALRQLLPMTEDRLRNGLDGHQQIVEALSVGDIEGAKTCLQAHIIRVQSLQSDAASAHISVG